MLVSGHCRRNPKGKEDLLYASNIRHIYHTQLIKTYPRLPAIKGFKDHDQHDPMIQFWTDYWKNKGELNKQVDPLLIKSLIAVESSFRPDVITNDPSSTAAGLMQITKSTIDIINGNPNSKSYVEIRTNPIYLEYHERLYPIVNIATGIRWLAHKIKWLPSRYKTKDVNENIRRGVVYYHSWDKEREDHAKKVYRLYNETLKK